MYKSEHKTMKEYGPLTTPAVAAYPPGGRPQWPPHGHAGSFAAVALLITTIGVFALVAMSTVQRTRELGVRAALGADAASLVWTCARGSFALALVGLAAGAVASAWAVALLRSFLFEVDPLDPRLWSLAAGSVLAATAAGALIPAVRAGRVDPTIALRAE